MFSLFLRPAADLEELLIGELWECGTTGIVEEDGGIRAFFDSDADAEKLLARFAASSAELRYEAVVDWEQATRDAWPAMCVGERFYLVPPWSREAAPEGRLRLTIHPGMACGTGRHPATQLCLEAIERHVRPGDSVADIGTGSGILASAAALMGARPVVGCDIDFETIAYARERVDVSMFVGSAAAIRSGWAEVIVANIDSATIEQLAHEFERIRKPVSALILSGFPEWDVPEGFQPKETLSREEWRCFVC